MSELLVNNILCKCLAVVLFVKSMAMSILASSVMPVSLLFNGNYGVILVIFGVITLVYTFIVFKFVPKKK
ncbi:hypothetical protein [Francisella tularensis]|uniref:hypothetical protein n=1 Tax=Francisella tularensis TaxID=263 RepID=UPI001CC2B9B3|nr:hypothetical protein [Francisella tularensis]